MKKKALLIQAAAVCILSLQSCLLPEEEADSIITTAAYAVSGTVLEADDEASGFTVGPAEAEIHRKAWENILRIIPDEYEHYIVRFEVFSDGEAETLAYVEPYCGDGGISGASWTLAVDMMDSWDRTGGLYEDALTETLVHEFAHLLSLNDSQIAPVSAEQDDEDWFESWDFDTAYRTDEGIAKQGAYIDSFFRSFWSPELLRERRSLEENSTRDGAGFEYTAFAAEHYTDYVSDYAMTNPEEDFAESFMFFVLSDAPEKTTAATEKILFFYSFPELRELRSEIRTALGIQD